MSQSTFNTTVLCLMMSWQVPAFAQLDSIEQAMIAFIDVSNEAAEELLIVSRIDGELSYALPNLSTLRTENFAVVSKLA